MGGHCIAAEPMEEIEEEETQEEPQRKEPEEEKEEQEVLEQRTASGGNLAQEQERHSSGSRPVLGWNVMSAEEKEEKKKKEKKRSELLEELQIVNSVIYLTPPREPGDNMSLSEANESDEQEED